LNAAYQKTLTADAVTTTPSKSAIKIAERVIARLIKLNQIIALQHALIHINPQLASCSSLNAIHESDQ
jgi:hypothetical protein